MIHNFSIQDNRPDSVTAFQLAVQETIILCIVIKPRESYGLQEGFVTLNHTHINTHVYW